MSTRSLWMAKFKFQINFKTEIFKLSRTTASCVQEQHIEIYCFFNEHFRINYNRINHLHYFLLSMLKDQFYSDHFLGRNKIANFLQISDILVFASPIDSKNRFKSFENKLNPISRIRRLNSKRKVEEKTFSEGIFTIF